MSNTADVSALDRLLAAEREIAEGEAAAVAKAQALLDTARRDCETREGEAEAALALELAALDARARARQQAAVAEIEAAASRLATRYSSLTDAEVTRLAAFVCDRVTGLINGDEP